MPVFNLFKGIPEIKEKKKNNNIINNSKKNETKIIYIFMNDIEIKKLFNDYSINTSNNIKIEKKGTNIEFIKKISRINNSVVAQRINNSVVAQRINNSVVSQRINNSVVLQRINNSVVSQRINNNSTLNKNKIEKIKEILKNINYNIIIYIKSSKLIKNNINNKNLDYIFLKEENNFKNNNFKYDLKKKIKYLKSDNIFSEIVNIINKPSNNSNNNETNSNLNLTNTESINSNLSNSISTELYINNKDKSPKEKTKYYYILGLGCSKKKSKEKIYEMFFKETNGDVEIICKGYSKALYTIGKRIIGKSPSINSKYLLDIQNNILKDLEKYKEVIVIGHSFGGSIVSTIAKNLNNKIVESLNNKITKNLKMYTVGSIYIPQKELKHINIIHFMNFSDISLTLSKTNYTKLKNSFKKNLKSIILPDKFVETKSMEYYISNNKQLFYININANYNKKFFNRVKPEAIKKHNQYYYIQYCILNSEQFRNELAKISNVANQQ